MRSALLHYWLTGMRGGEKVLLELCRVLPDADIFTHAWNPGKFTGEPFAGHRIAETFIGSLPGAKNSPQKYLPLMPSALKRLRLDGYDLLVSSESGPAKGVVKPAGAVHLCYCHTPMRYLWDMYGDYYRQAGLGGKLAMTLFRNYLRRCDLRSAESVDAFAANSAFVARRIKRIYGRDAQVIHPPAEVEYYAAGREAVPDELRRDAPYLYVGELVGYKRADLAVKACLRMKRKLTVVGKGPQLRELRRLASDSPDIVFAGRLEADNLRRAYASSRALLFPGIEDFGIVPVEAQAAGTPVIAFGEGGALETVEPGVSGVFFNEQDTESLCAAMEEFEGRLWDRAVVSKRVERFSAARFREEFSDFAAAAAPGIFPPRT